MSDPDFLHSEFAEFYEEEDRFFQSFEFKKVLGKGMFGKVYHAYSSSQKRDVALKIIKKAGFSREKLNLLRYEELILSQLDHPNVVQFFLSKESTKYIIMVLELAQGENLQKIFNKGTKFNVETIREAMKKLLNAVQYIHTKKIVHRDIKPANIVLDFGKQHGLETLKLVDFGLSFQIQGNYFIGESVGTPIFFAPELVLKKPYSQLCDIWSCGIVFYMFFSQGIHPIYSPNSTPEEFFQKVLTFKCTFPENMDSLSIDFFKKMCCLNPEERFDAHHCLNHPWLTGKAEFIFTPIQKFRIFNNVEKMMEFFKATIFLQHLSKKSVKDKKTTTIKITKNLSEPFFPEVKTPQNKPNSLKNLERIIISHRNSEFIPFRKNSGLSKINDFMQNDKNNPNFGFSPKLNFEKKLRIKTVNHESFKKSLDLSNSTRSCSQAALKCEKKPPETSFLPQITKNTSYKQQKMTNSCNLEEGLRLPSVQKVSKFKSNQIKINL